MRNDHKKVLVLGYFGYENNQLDGQTVKTRNIFTLLKSKEDSFFKTVSYFDTQTFQKSKINLIRAFTAISKVDLLFYLPAHNNLKWIFPFIFIYCKLFNIKIHYIVVGGWLAEYLKNKPLHKWMLKRIEGIYPENIELVENLKQHYNFTNVFQLHNFRIVEAKSIIPNKSEKIKLVFMARVHPLKGINTVFKLADELVKNNIVNVEINVYGPVFPDYDADFKLYLNKNNLVRYMGVLQPDDIYNTLVNYDLMLFPTQYFTEGFPGSILDSYIAEVPVVVSRWKYVEEFVKDNESGIICEFDNPNDFIDKTINLLNNKEKLRQLNNTVKKEKHKYSTQAAWHILKERI